MKMTMKLVGFIALFFAASVLALLLAIWIAEWRVGNIEDRPAVLLGIVFGALVLLIAAFVPFLNFAMRRSYVFEPAHALPVGEEELREEILAINTYGAPVAVSPKGRKLVVHWRYVDGEVWGLLEMRRVRQSYELHLRFDDAQKEVVLTDVKKSVKWGAGPHAIRFGFGFTRGYLAGVEIGQAWGIRRNFSFGKAYEFRFDPSEIKQPVINTILQSGWTARFAMW